MELEEYEYRDPGQVVSDVLARESVHEGDVVLALVYEPATTQSVIHTIRLSPEPWESISGYVRARMLADIARSMPVPPWQPGKFPRHSIMTIVFRRGFAVIGAGECEWLIGWRYSNHGVHAFSGDLTVVTEHGWFDFMSGLGGRQPRFDILQGRVA